MKEELSGWWSVCFCGCLYTVFDGMLILWFEIKSRVAFNSKKSTLIENDFCPISVLRNSGKHFNKEAIHIWQRKSVQEMQLSSNWRQSLKDSDPLAQSPSSDLIRSLALGGSWRSHLLGWLYEHQTQGLTKATAAR